MNEFLLSISLLAVPVLLAVTVHEVAHGWVAYRLGDPTAKLAGRLTLNPLKHLDPVGTLAFIITRMVGWAKPVPINPANLRRPRQDMVWVAAAGPAANVLLAVGFALLYHLAGRLLAGVAPEAIVVPLLLIAQTGVYVNVGLAIFNILPVPPLDGGNIALGLLPRDLAIRYDRLRPYGFLLLLVLIFTGAVAKVVFPVIHVLAALLLLGH
jgi:Zn-dependent protease